MAWTLLRALGLGDAQMANAEAAWNANEKIWSIHPAVKITAAQLATFKQAAANAGMGGGEFSKVVFRRGLASLAANPSVEQEASGSGAETFSAGFSINMADYDTLLSTSLASAYVPADSKKGHVDATIGMAMLRGIRECEPGDPVVIEPQDVQVDRFTRAVAFTVSGYAGQTALADFPVAVRLAEDSPEGFRYADLADPTSGSELRFADAAGKSLDSDVEEWNTNGVSLVWVKVPSLARGTTFTMYYGGTPTDEVRAFRAWSADNVGGRPMAEAEGDVSDAAGNGLAASPNGSGAAYSVAGEGVFGRGRFNTSVRNKGTGRSMLVVNDSYLLDLGSDFTLSGWVKMTDTIDGGGLARIAVRSADGATPEWEVALADAMTLQACGNGGATLSGTIPSAMDGWRRLRRNGADGLRRRRGRPERRDHGGKGQQQQAVLRHEGRPLQRALHGPLRRVPPPRRRLLRRLGEGRIRPGLRLLPLGLPGGGHLRRRAGRTIPRRLLHRLTRTPSVGYRSDPNPKARP